MAERLPVPGSDNGTWGEILNDFLGVAHNPDGTLASGTVGASQVIPGSIPASGLTSSVQASLAKADTAVTYINPRDPAYGALGNGVANDSAAFVAAFAAASSAGVDILIPAGTYKLNSGFSWNAVKHGVVGTGNVTLDFSGMTSGYAITVTGTSSQGNAYNSRSTIHQFKNLRILGPDTDATVTDCFYLNDPANLSQLNFEALHVYGFRDQWYFDTNNWCIRWYGCTMGHAHRRILAFYSGTNAGENYSFFGCTLYSSTNATYDATAIYADVGAGADIYCFGCSFDYNDIDVNQNSGTVNLIGCHLESHANNGNPMVLLSYTPGSEYTTFTMSGGVIAPTETAPGRDHYIRCVTGDQIHISLLGVNFGTWNRKADIVKVIAGTPTMVFEGGTLGVGTAPNVSRPGELTNIISNAGFETGAIDGGWQNQGTVVYSVQSTTVKSGTYALRIAGTGVVGTTTVYQRLPCPSHSEVLLTAEMAADTMVGGTTVPRIQWLAADYSVISTISFVGVTANQSFARVGGKVVSPAGTAFMSLQFHSTNLNGNVYVDDVYLTLLKPYSGGAGLIFGTSATTPVVGNDSRITGAAQKASNLSDLASASTARTNLGLGTAATISSTAGGDLTGTLPSPTVAKINGTSVPASPDVGHVLTATSATAAVWAAPSGTADVQVFTAGGTWTKPAGATSVAVTIIGPGGGGGAGARGPSGTALSGGGAGGGGGMSVCTFPAAVLTSTVAVAVGTGGTGAAGQTVDGTAGVIGGTASSGSAFGTYAAGGRGSPGGGGGLAVAGTAGAAGFGLFIGTAGGAGSATGGAGAVNGAFSMGAPGGGSGGGISTGAVASAGAAGGTPGLIGAGGGTAGTSGGGNGGNGTASTSQQLGGGGGGGGSSVTGAAGNGGNGGIYGAGGGGGGASLNGSTSGAGGNGGNGIVIVTTYF